MNGKATPPTESADDSASESRVEAAVSVDSEIGQATLQINTSAGTIIRIFWQRSPGTRGTVIAEKLDKGSMKRWTEIDRAAVLFNNDSAINEAIQRCIVNVSQHITFP